MPHPLLSLVVPTLNEADNLRHLVRRVDRVLRGVPRELIVVDDASTDGTAELADDLAASRPGSDISVLHRPLSERGLSAAILAGFTVAQGDILAVIDADLQHDPAVVPVLVAALDAHDLAIGSRYTFRGRTCGWSWLREVESRAAAFLTRTALNVRIGDPLSGCFAIRRAAFTPVAADLHPRGWKLLLDIISSAPGLRIAEIPMTFRARCRGRTKMSWRVVAAWLTSLRELRRARVARTLQTTRVREEAIALP